MEDNFNATQGQAQTGPDGGAQERVVDAPESQTGSEAALDGREDVVDPRQEDGNEGAAGDEADQQGRKQTRQDNAAIRSARLAARREAEADIRRQTDEDIAKSGVINPYTKKPFASVQEFREYGERQRQAEVKRVAKETGRSEEDVEAELADKDFVRQMRRQADRDKAAKKAEEERRAFIQKDVQDFVKRHPGVDVEKLENNKAFLKFCGSRFGREPLGDLYDDFMEVVGQAGQAAVAKQEGRSQRSTGGGSTGGMAMTPSQQKALDAWNEANPDMTMTAKEFLSRQN